MRIVFNYRDTPIEEYYVVTETPGRIYIYIYVYINLKIHIPSYFNYILITISIAFSTLF